jgi:hypothetical protein
MLGQGAHSFAVAAVDAAGHVDASPATASWTVDTVAPDLMIVSGPNDGDTVGPRVTFMFTVSEGTTECAVDGAPFAPCANPVSFNLPAAAHVFSVRATDAAGNATTLTRSFTVACAAPTTAAAAGLLHLDDTGQILANATGGANAVLGTTDQVEAVDPAPTVGRFGGALAFNATESDLVSWPIGLSSTSSDFAIELWAAPEALAGTRDVIISGDGGIAIRVTAASATTVRFSATAVGSGGVQHTVTSAPVAAGSWHWVLATLQEPTLRLWVDGAVTQIADTRLNLVPALASLRLGGNYGGALDEVWLSQAAITTDEGALERYCPL